MAHEQMVRTYVERLLSEAYDEPVPARSAGAYRLPLGAPAEVDVDFDHPTPRVVVRALLAEGREPSSDLLGFLNRLNASLAYGRVSLQDGRVIGEVDILASHVDHPHLRNAVGVLAYLLDVVTDELDTGPPTPRCASCAHASSSHEPDADPTGSAAATAAAGVPVAGAGPYL